MIFFFRRSEISLDHPRSLCGREEQWLRVQCEHLSRPGLVSWFDTKQELCD